MWEVTEENNAKLRKKATRPRQQPLQDWEEAHVYFHRDFDSYGPVLVIIM